MQDKLQTRQLIRDAEAVGLRVIVIDEDTDFSKLPRLNLGEPDQDGDPEGCDECMTYPCSCDAEPEVG